MKKDQLECVGDVCLAPPSDGDDSGDVSAGTAGNTTIIRTAEQDTTDLPAADPLEQGDNDEEQKLPSPQEPRKPKRPTKVPSNSLKKIHTQQELETLINSNEAVIVEFITTWCGACKSIEPLVTELATEHGESVQLAQVICDKNKETKKLAAAMGVTSYPVFFVFEQSREIQKWNGADVGKLEKAFDKVGGGGGGGKKGGKKGGGGKKKGGRR